MRSRSAWGDGVRSFDPLPHVRRQVTSVVSDPHRASRRGDVLRLGARRFAPMVELRLFQPAALRACQGDTRACARQTPRREPQGVALESGIVHRRHPDRDSGTAHHAAARSRTAATLHPGAVRDCVCGGPPHALRRCRHGGRDIVGARRVEIRAAGLSARACGNVLEPGAGRTGRGLPADSGPHHGRFRRLVGQRLSTGDAGSAAVPAGGAQRLHLFGAGRGAGVCGASSSC